MENHTVEFEEMLEPTEHQYVEEYIQLNENGRMFWRSLYNLAGVTFAINGTLAAAYGFLLFGVRAAGAPTPMAMSLAISIIAIVYNIGAVQNMRFMYDRFEDILAAMRHGNYHKRFYVPQLFARSLDTRFGRGVRAWNTGFFLCVMAAWIAATGFSGFVVFDLL